MFIFFQPHCLLVTCNLKFGAPDLKMSEPEDRVFCMEQGPFAPLIVACVESQKKVLAAHQRNALADSHIYLQYLKA